MAVPLCPESKLVLAIFRQAALDLRSGNPRLVRDARAWVLERGGTFDRYSGLLGLDSGAVRRAMLDGSRQRRIGPLRAQRDPRVGPKVRDWDADLESA